MDVVDNDLRQTNRQTKLLFKQVNIAFLNRAIEIANHDDWTFRFDAIKIDVILESDVVRLGDSVSGELAVIGYNSIWNRSVYLTNPSDSTSIIDTLELTADDYAEITLKSKRKGKNSITGFIRYDVPYNEGEYWDFYFEKEYIVK